MKRGSVASMASASWGNTKLPALPLRGPRPGSSKHRRGNVLPAHGSRPSRAAARSTEASERNRHRDSWPRPPPISGADLIVGQDAIAQPDPLALISACPARSGLRNHRAVPIPIAELRMMLRVNTLSAATGPAHPRSRSRRSATSPRSMLVNPPRPCWQNMVVEERRISGSLRSAAFAFDVPPHPFFGDCS